MSDNINTDIELMTDFALDVDDRENGITVLIKHNYYSSDNENGINLLNSMLDGLTCTADRISLLILTDSAVKLLDTSDKLSELISLVNMTLICNDSAEFYNIELQEFPSTKVHVISMTEITEHIIESRPEIIIE